MNVRKIEFRGRRKDNGEWIEGNYFHNFRKGESHNIVDFDHNNWYVIYRESLQMRDWGGEFEDV